MAVREAFKEASGWKKESLKIEVSNRDQVINAFNIDKGKCSRMLILGSVCMPILPGSISGRSQCLSRG
jgi:hypothetical protein